MTKTVIDQGGERDSFSLESPRAEKSFLQERMKSLSHDLEQRRSATLHTVHIQDIGFGAEGQVALCFDPSSRTRMRAGLDVPQPGCSSACSFEVDQIQITCPS